jgi:MbtH protein
MFEDDTRQYAVVRNDEHQYSIWPADREPPAGWTAAGPVATRTDCLEHIRGAWTDLRPKSLRDRMDGEGAERS